MEILKKFAKTNNIEISDGQVKQFELFTDMLLEKNKVMNLTAIEEPLQVEVKHMVDSLESVGLIKKLTDNNFKLIDIGTGAGFPGIPLKIVFPENEFVLLDSLNKRIQFVNEICQSLKLRNVSAVAARAEDYANVSRETFDVCVSRAVAKLNVLLEYCLPFVKLGGYCLLYKSADYKEELAEAEKAICELGGEFVKAETFTLPEACGERSILIFKKVKKTPDKYPRKAGKPSKSPIV